MLIICKFQHFLVEWTYFANITCWTVGNQCQNLWNWTFLIAYRCTPTSHFCHMPSWTVSASSEVFTRGELTQRRVWGGGWAHLPTWLGSCPCRSAGRGLLEGGGGGGGEREEEGEWSWPAADLAAALPQVGNPLLSLSYLLTPSKCSVGKLGARYRWIYGTSEKCKFVACMKIRLCLEQYLRWAILLSLSYTLKVQRQEISSHVVSGKFSSTRC